MAGELNLTATLHRSAYQVMSTAQQAYLLLTTETAVVAPVASAQLVNFGLVLDHSGSMGGEKLRQLKTAAKLLIDRLGAQDLLSVVVFDDVADIIVPSGPVQDREALKRKIDAIEERGGTHMSTGMDAGFKQIQGGLTAGRVSRMLLLTDGQTWEDQAQCEGLADQCRIAGVPINVLGLGVGAESNWDPRLLESLAQRSGGEWTVVDAPDKISAVFASTLQAMQGSAAANASLTMRMVEGITVRAVWRVTPLIARLNQQGSLHDIQAFLGDIQYGSEQSLLIDLLLPARQAGNFRLIQADITYDVPAIGLSQQKASADIVVNYTTDVSLANQFNQKLMNLIERVTAHKLQTQALDEAAAGDMQKATKRLRAAATRLLEIGEIDMAQQANQQAQQLEQNQPIDPASAQKMRYQTKKLTEKLD